MIAQHPKPAVAALNPRHAGRMLLQALAKLCPFGLRVNRHDDGATGTQTREGMVDECDRAAPRPDVVEAFFENDEICFNVFAPGVEIACDEACGAYREPLTGSRYGRRRDIDADVFTQIELREVTEQMPLTAAEIHHDTDTAEAAVELEQVVWSVGQVIPMLAGELIVPGHLTPSTANEVSELPE